jgi:ATP-binding cassette subfamily F protein 2
MLTRTTCCLLRAHTPTLTKTAAEWDGGLVLVSHDFRLIGQVAKEIWEVRDGGVHMWRDDIVSYKQHLKERMEALRRKDGVA